MYKVRKRDGKIVSFNIEKISDAIIKAFESLDKDYDKDVIDFLSLKVTSDFNDKIKDNIIGVEDIQDSVERVLIKADYADVAKAYILYRKLHEKQRAMDGALLDYKNVVNSYLNVSDWRVKEN